MASKDGWSADTYNKNASFVYSKEFTSPILDLLNAKPGEHIIDFGCGSGELTLQLKQIVGTEGVVIGVDSSANMIGKAHSNGLSAAYVADVQNLEIPFSKDIQDTLSSSLPPDFDYKFDAVFSNAALHWCKRSPSGVIESAARALKKGGRFVVEMGGFTNCVGLRMAIHEILRRRGLDPVALDPWYFPSPQDQQKLLEAYGFRVTHISLNPRFTPLGGDIIDWQRTFARTSAFASLSDAEAEDAMSEVQVLCAPDCRDASGNWALMYTRLRFAAILD